MGGYLLPAPALAARGFSDPFCDPSLSVRSFHYPARIIEQGAEAPLLVNLCTESVGNYVRKLSSCWFACWRVGGFDNDCLPTLTRERMMLSTRPWSAGVLFSVISFAVNSMSSKTACVSDCIPNSRGCVVAYLATGLASKFYKVSDCISQHHSTLICINVSFYLSNPAIDRALNNNN